MLIMFLYNRLIQFEQVYYLTTIDPFYQYPLNKQLTVLTVNHILIILQNSISSTMESRAHSLHSIKCVFYSSMRTNCGTKKNISLLHSTHFAHKHFGLPHQPALSSCPAQSQTAIGGHKWRIARIWVLHQRVCVCVLSVITAAIIVVSGVNKRAMTEKRTHGHWWLCQNPNNSNSSNARKRVGTKSTICIQNGCVFCLLRKFYCFCIEWGSSRGTRNKLFLWITKCYSFSNTNSYREYAKGCLEFIFNHNICKFSTVIFS